ILQRAPGRQKAHVSKRRICAYQSFAHETSLRSANLVMQESKERSKRKFKTLQVMANPRTCASSHTRLPFGNGPCCGCPAFPRASIFGRPQCFFSRKDEEILDLGANWEHLKTQHENRSGGTCRFRLSGLFTVRYRLLQPAADIHVAGCGGERSHLIGRKRQL